MKKVETICYTPKEVKEILNISQSQVYALFAKEVDPKFPAFRLGKSLRIRKQDFEMWLDEQVMKNRVA